MKNYLYLLLLVAVVTACSDDEKQESINVNDLTVNAEQLQTPLAPKNPGNSSVWFSMVGRNIFYANPSNNAVPQFMLSYNLDTNAFTGLTPHESVCACGLSSKIVSDSNSLFYIANDAFKYSIDDNTWSEITYPDDSKDNNGETGILHHNGKIYFLGGREADKKFKYYDIATDSWGTGPDCLYNVQLPDMVAADNKIYALGGNESNSKFSVYEVGKGWTALPDLTFESPNDQSITTAVFQNKYIFVYTYTGIYIYDIKAGKWRDEPVILNNLSGNYINLFSDDAYIYAVGKTNSNEFLLYKITVGTKL